MSDDLRSRILLTVDAYPGLHLREIQRRIGCSAMLAEYHLNALEKAGLVESQVHGRYRDFFPVRSTGLVLDATDKKWLGFLRRPPILAIALLLLEKGSMRPTEISEATQLATSTTGYQLKTMAQEGLVIQDFKDGRTNVRLADSARVLEILKANHPTPDAVSEYASLWGRVFSNPAPAEPELVEEEDLSMYPPQIRDLAKATRSVWVALQEGPQTQKELVLASGRARRTVYNALKQFEALGILSSHVHMLDTRQTKYWLTDNSGTQDSKENP